MTKMRAIIAQRMVESKRISPHVHTVYKVDMTRIVRLREREKARFEQRNGVKLTYMPFIAAAAVAGAAQVPHRQRLARWTSVHPLPPEHQPRHRRRARVGTDRARHQAGRETQLPRASPAPSPIWPRRARTKKLLPDEVSGGTFTLTNSGVFGGEFGTPIINQPESAILAIGGLNKEPVVLTDADGNDTIAIRSMQHFCLGFDHRIIDGADAGKFMFDFKKALENWNKRDRVT